MWQSDYEKCITIFSAKEHIYIYINIIFANVFLDAPLSVQVQVSLKNLKSSLKSLMAQMSSINLPVPWYLLALCDPTEKKL